MIEKFFCWIDLYSTLIEMYENSCFLICSCLVRFDRGGGLSFTKDFSHCFLYSFMLFFTLRIIQTRIFVTVFSLNSVYHLMICLLIKSTRCFMRIQEFPRDIKIWLSPTFWEIRRCPWCSRYRRRKWTRRHEFNSWTRLIAFHIALITLEKVWIQLFSLQLWVNSRAD